MTHPRPIPKRFCTRLGQEVDLVIDAGPCGTELTTVIDLTSDTVEIVRQGHGDIPEPVMDLYPL